MFEDEEIILLCIKHQITVEQYFFMWLIRKQDWHQPEGKSLAKQYVKLVRAFELDLIRDLVEKDWIDDFNSPGRSIPEMYVLKPKANVFFIDEECGEELFREYPATFPLHEKGASFLARTGGPKDDLIAEYEKLIGYSRKKHEFVIRKLRRYVILVREGKLNGHKIVDWIRMQLWESIEEFEQTDKPYDASEDI